RTLRGWPARPVGPRPPGTGSHWWRAAWRTRSHGRPWLRPIEAIRRAGVRGVNAVAGDPATHPALDRFLRSLAARDASPHTVRAYNKAVGTYLGWLEDRGIDWTRPARSELRSYLARLGSG